MAKVYKLIFVTVLLFSSIVMSQNNPQKGVKRALLHGKIQSVEMDIDLLTYAIESNGELGRRSFSSELTSKKLTLIDLKKELEEL